jgi:predicted solute-binding protein
MELSFEAFADELSNAYPAAHYRPSQANHELLEREVKIGCTQAMLLCFDRDVMIVFLGVVVGGMVVSMYLPIFDMINAVQ